MNAFQEADTGRALGAGDQLALHSEFQASQGYIVKPVFREKETNWKDVEPCGYSWSWLPAASVGNIF